MKFWNTIRGLDNTFPWSFLGTITGIGFGLFGIYVAFLYEENPKIAVDIISNAPLVDVREEIEDVKILYKDTDITKTDKELQLIIFKVYNNSRIDILKNYFDENDPFGFQLSSGEIVKREVIEASSDYLSKNLQTNLVNKNTISINPFIFDANSSFTLQIIAILPERTHTSQGNTGIVSIGKIAGVKEVTISKPYKQSTISVNNDALFNRFISLFSLAIFGIIAILALVSRAFVSLIKQKESMIDNLKNRIFYQEKELEDAARNVESTYNSIADLLEAIDEQSLSESALINLNLFKRLRASTDLSMGAALSL
ncbi:hypothetical protein Lepto7375DRAFT_1075 [Leptolyngbya sp. PCC 7375]|nr:hypothetical protein Lepto7375DRAFT_1075 [Leptolyngbya sp. PCC 7375]